MEIYLTGLTRHIFLPNRVVDVMVSTLASSVVDHWFDPLSCQPKDYKIGICCFSAKHVALRRKSKDWLTRNQDNVSERGDMSTRILLFQWANIIHYKNPTKRDGLVQRGYIIIIFSSNVTCSRHDIAEQLLICCQTIITYSFTPHTYQVEKCTYLCNTVPSPLLYLSFNIDRSLLYTGNW